MIVAVGCDHAGIEVKAAVAAELQAAGAEVRDFSLANAAADDYPDVADEVARAVASGTADYGVLVCGTGIGMSITANKVGGVRAALCWNPFTARMSREHNDANVLCLGGRTTTPEAARAIVQEWIAAAPSTEERHVRRRAHVSAIERRGQGERDRGQDLSS